MVDFLRGATIGEATEPGTGNIFFRDAVRTPNSTIFLNPYED